MENQKLSFFQKVYELARQIPEGKVSTYGDIANYLGGSARMVGWAMNAAHLQLPAVPAHRVVNRNGLLTGKFHFGSPNLMEQLLSQEGIKVENDKIVDFQQIRWKIEMGHV